MTVSATDRIATAPVGTPLDTGGGTLQSVADIVAGGRAVRTLSTNYVSGTGTAGVDNTSQNVKTISIPADTLVRVGDRIRVRVYWIGTTGNAITGTIKVNTVTVSTKTDGAGAANFQVNEAWLHYIDATHANIIESGDPPGSSSTANSAGFNWAAAQDAIISQNAALNNHIVVYFFAIDVFPLGVA